MKHIQIRKGVFETNSSSMHSIAIKKEHKKAYTNTTGYDLKHIFLYKGMRYVYSDDINFERYPFKILFSMFDKALYVIASKLGLHRGRYIVGDEYAEKFLNEELYPILCKYCPAFKGFKFQIKYEDVYIDPAHPDKWFISYDPEVDYVGEDRSPSGYVFRQEDGREIPLVEDTNHSIEVVNYGYIDHQSVGLLDGFLENSGISLEDFLTDSAYIVVIDGDEYRDFQRYLEAGIIKADDFEKIYSPEYHGWSTEVTEKIEIVEIPCDD